MEDFPMLSDDAPDIASAILARQTKADQVEELGTMDPGDYQGQPLVKGVDGGTIALRGKVAELINRSLREGMEPEVVADVFDLTVAEVNGILAGSPELQAASRAAMTRRAKRLVLSAQKELLHRVENDSESMKTKELLAALRVGNDLIAAQGEQKPTMNVHLHAGSKVTPNALLDGLLEVRDVGDASRFDAIEPDSALASPEGAE